MLFSMLPGKHAFFHVLKSMLFLPARALLRLLDGDQHAIERSRRRNFRCSKSRGALGLRVIGADGDIQPRRCDHDQKPLDGHWDFPGMRGPALCSAGCYHHAISSAGAATAAAAPLGRGWIGCSSGRAIAALPPPRNDCGATACRIDVSGSLH